MLAGIANSLNSFTSQMQFSPGFPWLPEPPLHLLNRTRTEVAISWRIMSVLRAANKEDGVVYSISTIIL